MAEETPSRVVAIVPGAFKPPHAGHMGLIGDYAGQADKVIVMVSPKPRDGITAQQALAIWEIFLEELPYDNIEVMVSPNPSPVGSAFDFVENKNDNPNLAQPGDEILLGVSTKGGDDRRFCANVRSGSMVPLLSPKRKNVTALIDSFCGSLINCSIHFVNRSELFCFRFSTLI